MIDLRELIKSQKNKGFANSQKPINTISNSDALSEAKEKVQKIIDSGKLKKKLRKHKKEDE